MYSPSPKTNCAVFISLNDSIAEKSRTKTQRSVLGAAYDKYGIFIGAMRKKESADSFIACGESRARASSPMRHNKR